MSRITCLRMLLVVLIAAIMPTAYAAAPKSAPPSPAARFADYGHPGTFLLQRDGAAVQVIYGGDRAAKALSPASTIKPLLALIALETGVLDGADEIVPWDGRNYPHSPEWQTGMALRRAMQTSNESYFRVLATRIGHDRLAEWVKRIGYGNGHIGDSAVDAWHDGVLTITTQQQLAFIDRLRRNDLPFATSNIATVKAAMLDSDRQGIRIYGKTGTHLDNSSTGNAWWIGWVEGGKTPATSFVLGAELQTMDKREKRIALGKALLRDAGVLPAN
jgi:beta-lactamase class D